MKQKTKEYLFIAFLVLVVLSIPYLAEIAVTR
jgi:hypothetical protein